MEYLSWIVAGALIALISRFVMPGLNPLGNLGVLILGVATAMIGAMAVKVLDPATTMGFDLRCLLAATIAAGIALFAYRAYAVGDGH